MYHIKELLPKVLKKRGLQDHAKASHVILHTQEWIITELEGYQDQLIAKSFKDGILLINAENSVCAQELNQVLLELKEHLSEKGHNILEIRIIRSQ
ncbi:MAG: DciA family protein [Candidatus Peribacteraceae bacterium]|nr:DciA family protein [Candidatus Peribacteraceae bacterium]MDP7454286.1 DciA family protein [Candidatus Peribacteraceae bacterium]MDP7645674.1 DciA family protein [Candidatus Peribacteraceae bacterium]